MNSNNAIGALHLFLNEVPTGEIQNSNEKLITVLKLLAEAWSSLEGGNDQNIDPTKIHRAESIRWTPPILSFVLERHGGTVNGSSRADLH